MRSGRPIPLASFTDSDSTRGAFQEERPPFTPPHPSPYVRLIAIRRKFATRQEALAARNLDPTERCACTKSASDDRSKRLGASPPI